MSPYDTMTKETKMDNPDGVRARARAAADRLGLTQKQMAQRIGGVSASTLSEWLSGRYAGDVSAVDAKVERWLQSLASRARHASRGRADPGFKADLPTAQRIWANLAQAQHLPDMVVFAGAPGVGKTITARAYQAANPNVTYAMMGPDTGTPPNMLREIAEGMGLNVRNFGELRREIGEKVRDAGGLIVIDEAQFLSKPALDMARTLFDRYGVGIAFLGNHGFFAGTMSPNARDSFAQFFSRIGSREKVARPADGDVAGMLDAWGIEAPAERKLLAGIAVKQWGLRGLSRTVRQARLLAEGRDEDCGLDHYRTAWTRLSAGGDAE